MASNTSSYHGPNFGLTVGQNSGNISAVFTAREKARPSPSSTVPFPRDPDFVDRSEVFARINEALSQPAARIGLAGIGGVGKSQLAIEASYRLLLQDPHTWVFWIYAGSADRFKQSFEEIATRTGIQGQRDPGVNVFELVEAWLNSEESRKWVIILDNVDDDRFLRERPAPDLRTQEKPRKPLLNYIPKSRGTVVVTGRNEKAVVKIVGRRNLIQIKHLPESEAIDLLHKKLILPGDEMKASNPDTSKRLVKELGFLPLAICQAAAFISYFSPCCSVSQYLEKFLKSDHSAVMLLEHEVPEEDSLNRDWDAENSIAKTWQLSFDHIARVHPPAADLLSLMCFFDPNEIPECVLHVLPKSPTQQTGLQSDTKKRSHSEMEDSDQEFAVNIGVLRDFALVTMISSKSFTMHRLVRLITQAWLRKQLGRFDFWYTQFINNLRREFPRKGENAEDLEKGRLLSPSIFQIYSFAVERQQRSTHAQPKMTAGEYHLLEMIRFYETQARERAMVDFLNDEMALAIRGLHRRIAEVSPNLDSASGEMLLLDTDSLIHDNQLDITRRLSMLAASQEHFQDVENMMKRVDVSGQDITVDFTDELASVLDVMKNNISSANASKITGLGEYCERMEDKVAREYHQHLLFTYLLLNQIE
ncbi:Tetratricopeptide-like helical [Penicillium verhagenii]|nr:Tetratricopeptide-like helical [Penicillium verhagenii]